MALSRAQKTEIIKMIHDDKKASKMKRIRAYNNVRKCLYLYKDMRIFVDQEKLFIEDFIERNTAGKSADMVGNGGGAGEYKGSAQELYVELLESAKDNYEATLLMIKKIERALDNVADDKRYPIIGHKYLFDNLTNEQIGEIMHCSESTVRRYEAEILQRIDVHFSGAANLAIDEGA